MEAGLPPAMEPVRRNPAFVAEGGPTLQRDRPHQSPVKSTWAEDDAVESKE